MSRLLLPLSLLALGWTALACPPKMSHCDWYEREPDAGENSFALGANSRSACFEIAIENPLPTLTSVSTTIRVENRSDADCVVALYASSTQPDVQAVPLLNPLAVPPEQIAGLGQRSAYVNLARMAGDVDQEDLHTWGCDDPPVPCYATIVGCPDPGIVGRVSHLSAHYCDPDSQVADQNAPVPGAPATARQIW